ncbi:MAG TPA: hypothetical protein VFR91_07585 [Dyella sp.]|nr:hypothetical protein [Dyella sp.]
MRRTRCLAIAAALLAAACARAQSSRDAYLAMFDRNGDGRVSEAEYVDYLDRGFVAMDANHDGTLEPAELPGGRGRAVTLAQHEADLRRQFRRLDRNHDGLLDARELTAPPGP